MMAKSPCWSTASTSPRSSTMPVNTRALLRSLAPGDAMPAEAAVPEYAAHRAAWARPASADRARAASHPDFNRRYRSFTGSASRWCGGFADYNRRFGVSPTPEHAYICANQCATRVIPGGSGGISDLAGHGIRAHVRVIVEPRPVRYDGCGDFDFQPDRRVTARILLVASSAATLYASERVG